MIFVLSGEGPTDLGSCNNAQGKCSGDDFDIGPMTVLIEQLVEHRVGYQLRKLPDQIYYLSEKALCEKAKGLPNRLLPARSKKKQAEMGYFYTNALRFCFGIAIARDQPRQDCGTQNGKRYWMDLIARSLIGAFRCCPSRPLRPGC